MSSGGACTSNSHASPSSRLASHGTVSGGEVSRSSASAGSHPGSNSRASGPARCTVTSARNTGAVEYSMSRAKSAGSISSGSRAANRWPVRNGSVIRSTRNVRQSSWSLSKPTRYQRLPAVTSRHGSTSRLLGTPSAET
jgi:hypothetical protein